jgi:hypothetical protein
MTNEIDAGWQKVWEAFVDWSATYLPQAELAAVVRRQHDQRHQKDVVLTFLVDSGARELEYDGFVRAETGSQYRARN